VFNITVAKKIAFYNRALKMAEKAQDE